jgi:hypothetical protein
VLRIPTLDRDTTGSAAIASATVKPGRSHPLPNPNTLIVIWSTTRETSMHTFTFICPQLTRLVVFAPDQESAVQSYAVWFDMRHGSFPETYCLTPGKLLRAILRLISMLLWPMGLPALDTTTLKPAGSFYPRRSFSPPKGDRSMFELYNFADDEDDYQVAIFAVDRERAEDVYMAVARKLGLMPEGWLGSEWDTWSGLGLIKHQWEAERRMVEGIGVYNSRTGWEILPIDYAAFELTPPPTKSGDTD